MMERSEPTKLDYRSPEPRPRKHSFLTAAGAISLASALLQWPWSYFVGIAAWLHYGDPPMTSAQNDTVGGIMIAPSVVAVVLGLLSLRLPNRRIGRRLGIYALLLVAFYICVTMYNSFVIRL